MADYEKATKFNLATQGSKELAYKVYEILVNRYKVVEIWTKES